jgi:hypothetical protein
MPAEEWQPFSGYPDSLALSVVEAFWSNDARYVSATAVIERYRSHRRWLSC